MERPFDFGAPRAGPPGAGTARPADSRVDDRSVPPGPRRRIAPNRTAAGFAGGLVAGFAAALAAALAGGALAGALLPPLPGALLVGAAAVGAAALCGIAVHRLRRSLASAQAERRAADERVGALEARLARAEAENAAKSRFLSEMSHELRTPLNAIIGFSEMMAHEVLGPHAIASYGDYARDIHASGRHLLSLADDVLDLARIETGHRTLLETPVALEPLAEECAQMMRLVAAERPVSLHCATSGAPRLWADERALRQVTLNLLANAVKFTPPGGEVRLSVGLGAEGAPYICVEDTGPGIGEAELPFASSQPRESTLDPVTGRGAGLGLAIVRALADLHGGTLSLTRRMGGGTCARVVLPAGRRLDPAPAWTAQATSSEAI